MFPTQTSSKTRRPHTKTLRKCVNAISSISSRYFKILLYEDGYQKCPDCDNLWILGLHWGEWVVSLECLQLYGCACDFWKAIWLKQCQWSQKSRTSWSTYVGLIQNCGTPKDHWRRYSTYVHLTILTYTYLPHLQLFYGRKHNNR